MSNEDDAANEQSTAAPDDEVAADASDAEDEETESTDSESTTGLQRDDFIEIEYTARTVDDDRLVDTTSQSVAEEEGLDVDDHTFKPRVIVIGAGHLFQRVEDDIVGKSVGDTGSVVIPATEAFGEYDPGDVQTVSADKIPEDNRHPGAHVDIDGRHGHVETIIGGRARVDFNHPLAGEAIEYEYEIVDIVEDTLDRAAGFLGMRFDVELEMWLQTDDVEEEVPVDTDDDEADDDEEPEMETEVVEYETLYIESDPMLAFNQEWLFQKRQIAQELIDRLDIDRVIVQEIIEGGGGMFGGLEGLDLEEGVDDLDVDADELVDELDADIDDVVEE